MKKNLSLILFIALLTGKAWSQAILTTLATFEATNAANDGVPTNNYGARPRGMLTLGGDGNFYGTAYVGGSNGYGTVYKVTTSGVLTTVTAFNNANGANPYAGVIQGNDGTLYGTTDAGGSNGDGTVFRLTTNGVLNSILSFDGSNGRHPNSLAFGTDGFIYGANEYGNPGGGFVLGSLFKIATNGVVSWITNFTGDVLLNDMGLFTNSSGANPWAGLTLGNDGNLYGTTSAYGFNGYGTVFEVTTDGVLTTVANFNNVPNGSYPFASLTLGRDGFFYGTTFNGGDYVDGTVFKVATNGALTELAAFTGSSVNANGVLTNSTGFMPWANLVVGIDGSLFGTADFGGINGNGTVFQVTTNGTLIILYSFPAGMMNNNEVMTNSSGIQPNALTLGKDGNLYGTTWYGGLNGNGTIFRINLSPPRILVNSPAFGVRSKQFGFSIIGTNGLASVVEACTNLSRPVWTPMTTNTGVLSYFGDAQWTNSKDRFYRFHSP